MDLREVECGRCGRVFFVCRRHERGQKYCPRVCSDPVRRRQKLDARLRHQQSELGRLDHRDHQRAHRQRERERVMDTATEKLSRRATVASTDSDPGEASIGCRRASEGAAGSLEQAWLGRRLAPRAGASRCAVCARGPNVAVWILRWVRSWRRRRVRAPP